MGSSLGEVREPTLSRHLNDVDLDVLFSMGEAVESLVVHPGWHHVTDLLDAEIEGIDRRLDSGGVALKAKEYAMYHGRRGGLKTARAAAEAILRHHHKRLEEQRAKHERGAESPQEATA